MANVIQIKKNAWGSTDPPADSDVIYGELAWENDSKRLFIGRQSTSGGTVVATHIGGKAGIANNNTVIVNDDDAADNDYAKFTATGIEGRSYAEVKTDLSLNNVDNTSLATWAGTSNITTLGTIGTGTWNGAAIPVANGGTGSTSASDARTALGLGSSDNVQFANATVSTLTCSDLTVNGTTTTVNTTDLVVKDSLIFLAKDQSGTPTLDSGFVVERGTSTNVGLIWDESADEFSFVTTSETGGTAGNVTISAQANVRASTFYGALSGNASTATNVAYSGLTGTVPTWDQDTTGNAANVTGTVAIANGGTGATTAAAAKTALGITYGIAYTNTVMVDSSTAADNDFAKFTASGLEGRSYAEVKTDLSLNNVENTALSTATIDGGTF